MSQVNWRETLRNSCMESITGDLEENRIAVDEEEDEEDVLIQSPMTVEVLCICSIE